MDNLRQQLRKLNLSIIDSLRERNSVIKKILDFKKIKNLEVFDGEQEKIVWRSLSFKSLDEARIFSQIIETQSGDKYPQWSLGEHLGKAPTTCAEQINPILLHIHFPDVFKELVLSDEWQLQIDALFSPR